jgi:phage terminase large subunit
LQSGIAEQEKSKDCVLNQQVIRTQLKKGIYYYILPTYSQAKRVMWDSLVREAYTHQRLLIRKNDSELAIYYKNGSIQRFVGAENPDSHRGSNPCDVVFDEYSEQPEEIWTAIFQPVLRENKGTATFIFTPKGKNHSWKLLQTWKG